MKTLSFAETLHPEDAANHIDNREVTEAGASAWYTVYNEARGDIPVAIAEKVDDDDNVGTTNGNGTNNSTGNSAGGEAGSFSVPSGQVTGIAEQSGNDGDNSNSNSNHDGTGERPAGKGCFYLEGFIGAIMVFSAVLATVCIELSAAIIYCTAAGFYWFSTIGDMPIFFRAIFLLVVQALMVCDKVLLAMSLMITELLGVVTVIVTSIFGGCNSGAAWHLYIRKICHLSRWAFRGFHDGWSLKRDFPSVGGDNDTTTMTTTVTTGQYQSHNDQGPDKEEEDDAAMSYTKQDDDDDGINIPAATVVETKEGGDSTNMATSGVVVVKRDDDIVDGKGEGSSSDDHDKFSIV